MGEVGDFAIREVGPGLVQGVAGHPRQLHREHPVQGPVNQIDPAPVGPAQIPVGEVGWMQDAGHRREGREGRIRSKPRQQRKGGAVGEAGQQDLPAIDGPMLADILQHGVKTTSFQSRGFQSPGVLLGGRRQQQEAAAPRLAQPGPEEIPSRAEAAVQRNHERCRPARVEVLGNVQREPTASVAFAPRAGPMQSHTHSIGWFRVEIRQAIVEGGLDEVARERRQRTAKGIQELLGAAVLAHAAQESGHPLLGGRRFHDQRNRGEARRGGFGQVGVERLESPRKPEAAKIAQRGREPLGQRPEALPHRLDRPREHPALADLQRVEDLKRRAHQSGEPGRVEGRKRFFCFHSAAHDVSPASSSTTTVRPSTACTRTAAPAGTDFRPRGTRARHSSAPTRT